MKTKSSINEQNKTKKIRKSNAKGRLTSISQYIQLVQLVIIIMTTIFMAVGGVFININSSSKAFNENLQNTSALITRLYDFTRYYDREDLCRYMDNIVEELDDVDIVSIVDKNNNRIYHTNHSLINTKYDGTHPDFDAHKKGYYTENDTGPSGSQRRTYSAIYNSDGAYIGFIMTICLRTSIMTGIMRTVGLFIAVTLLAIFFEVVISKTLSRKIKKEFLEFTEDFEGTKFLVDSMRANNHDFTNKLHVILGLIQIGAYDKAVSYIENISIIQRETVSAVMKAIDNPSFAALLIGKIARASECNVKFFLQQGSCFRSSDVDFPSEALVTITGNLIENALDAMNTRSLKNGQSVEQNELSFGVFTKPKELLLMVQDTGGGIKAEIQDKIFENGFSTKGSGRGVGLYHTKQLIESLGGTISFETQSGKGTCFMVNWKSQ